MLVAFLLFAKLSSSLARFEGDGLKKLSRVCGRFEITAVSLMEAGVTGREGEDEDETNRGGSYSKCDDDAKQDPQFTPNHRAITCYRHNMFANTLAGIIWKARNH